MVSKISWLEWFISNCRYHAGRKLYNFLRPIKIFYRYCGYWKIFLILIYPRDFFRRWDICILYFLYHKFFRLSSIQLIITTNRTAEMIVGNVSVIVPQVVKWKLKIFDYWARRICRIIKEILIFCNIIQTLDSNQFIMYVTKPGFEHDQAAGY